VAAAPSTSEPGARPLSYWSWGLVPFALAWLAAWALLFPEPLALAREQGALVAVGFAVAVVANATAIGGGLFFIPILVFGWGLSPVVALKLSIAGQAFGLTSGAIVWLRRGLVPREALRAALPPLLVGASVSSLLLHPSPQLVKGLFGPVSIALGVLALRQQGASAPREAVPPEALGPLRFVAAGGGILSGWVAIGAGELAAAYLMLAQQLRPDRAIGLGVVLLSAASIWLCGIHSFLLDGIPWEMALFLVLGTVFGARLGPWLAQRVPPRRLKQAFGAVAIADGLLFVASAWLGGR
jgi:uncharacterized membrane protein YfcA